MSDMTKSEIAHIPDRLSEIYRMQYELNTFIGKNTINDVKKLDWLFGFAYQISDEARELEKCCLTKWWVQEYKDGNAIFETVLDKDNAKIEAVDILHFLMSVFQILDMTPDDIYNIYCKKYETNIQRQKDGYSISGKTENDNLKIIENIHDR